MQPDSIGGTSTRTSTSTRPSSGTGMLTNNGTEEISDPSVRREQRHVRSIVTCGVTIFDCHGAGFICQECDSRKKRHCDHRLITCRAGVAWTGNEEIEGKGIGDKG